VKDGSSTVSISTNFLRGEVERDRWLTRDEADRLIQVCPPHLAALIRFALSTGCRAGEITGLEWERVDLARQTAWLRTPNITCCASRFAVCDSLCIRTAALLIHNSLPLATVLLGVLNHTKNDTSRGVPLNRDAVAVLQEQVGNHPEFCFTYRGAPIRWDVTNTAWHTALEKAGLTDVRFHDLRHTSASWHRQAGTSCDELKDLGGWKSRNMVDRYA
jgi:integrase